MWWRREPLDGVFRVAFLLAGFSVLASSVRIFSFFLHLRFVDGAQFLGLCFHFASDMGGVTVLVSACFC